MSTFRVTVQGEHLPDGSKIVVIPNRRDPRSPSLVRKSHGLKPDFSFRQDSIRTGVFHARLLSKGTDPTFRIGIEIPQTSQVIYSDWLPVFSPQQVSRVHANIRYNPNNATLYAKYEYHTSVTRRVCSSARTAFSAIARRVSRRRI